MENFVHSTAQEFAQKMKYSVKVIRKTFLDAQNSHRVTTKRWIIMEHFALMIEFVQDIAN